MLDAIAKNSLTWFPEKGIGYYSVDEFPYDQNYFDKYLGYADTDMGKSINKARIDLVSRHYDGPVVEVGIGCGQFVTGRENTYGFDVNPVAKQWLKNRRLWRNIYDGPCDALAFWDSLEHIKQPRLAISQAKKWVFLSIPVFNNCDHVLKSKHYRKDEHYWYFTASGLLMWFNDNGFSLRECDETEKRLGREDIMSFAFRRRDAS